MIPHRDGRIEDVTAEDPGPRWWEALALVLIAVVASAMIGVVAVASPSSLFLPPMLAGVHGVAHIMVVA
jgi:hypothetical protein